MRDIEEIAEWIVTGENRKAYEAPREKYGLPSFEVTERHVHERRSQSWPTLAEIDIDAVGRRHDRIIAKVKDEQQKAARRARRY